MENENPEDPEKSWNDSLTEDLHRSRTMQILKYCRMTDQREAVLTNVLVYVDGLRSNENFLRL